MNKTTISALIAGLLLALGVVGLMWKRGGGSEEPGASFLGLFGGANKPGNSEQPTGNARETVKTYSDQTYGFSFEQPEGFDVVPSMEDEDNYIIVVAAKKTEGGASSGFQIYISPFDEEGPITVERIKEDLPDMRIEQAKEISVGGAPALAFLSGDAGAGMREVWFIYKGSLYQITALAEAEEALARALETWKF